MSKDHEPKPADKKAQEPGKKPKAASEPAKPEPAQPEHARREPVKHEPINREYETKSSTGTIAIGRKLADLLAPPRLLILRGDLGAGKTTLVKGIATALGAADEDEVTSPTFTLVHEYSGSLEGKPVKLLHLDLYRLDADRQLESLGLDEMRTDDALILVEWGEKFPAIRKQADGEIVITSAGGDARKIVVTLK